MADNKKPEIEDFEKLLEAEKKRSEEYLNKLKYLQADFENFKKRFDREMDQIKCFSNERIIMQLLDVTDELELAIKNGEISSPTSESLLSGVEMTLNKLRKVLEQEGVSEIPDPINKAFDHSLHHAIGTEEREDVSESTVIEHIRKGYKLRGRVIRPSIVRVSIKPKCESNKNNNKMEEKQ
jgi:molecular chaperone GrpE